MLESNFNRTLFGTHLRWDAGDPALKRFGSAKTLPQAEFISAEDVQSSLGSPFDASIKWGGGDKRVRTVDPLLAKQVLSQLSYTPISSPGRAPSKLNNVRVLRTQRLTLGHYRQLSAA